MNCQIVGRSPLADQLDDRALPVFGHALALEQLHHRAVGGGLSARARTCEARLDRNRKRSTARQLDVECHALPALEEGGSIGRGISPVDDRLHLRILASISLAIGVPRSVPARIWIAPQGVVVVRPRGRTPLYLAHALILHAPVERLGGLVERVFEVIVLGVQERFEGDLLGLGSRWALQRSSGRERLRAEREDARR